MEKILMADLPLRFAARSANQWVTIFGASANAELSACPQAQYCSLSCQKLSVSAKISFSSVLSHEIDSI